MISVTLSSALAKLLHQDGNINHIPHKKKYTGLINWLHKHQGNLTPVFSGIDNEAMQIYFTLHSEKEISDAALENLQVLNGIEGAYRKPDDSLPG